MAKCGLYGSVALVRHYCNDCETDAFYIDGELKCCGKRIEKPKLSGKERMSESLTKRLSDSVKSRALSLQHNRCYICGVDLLADLWYKTRSGRIKKMTVEFDHFIPRSYCASNDLENIYAMCILCNRFKGSKMYEDRDEATRSILSMRESQGLLEYYSSIEIEASR